MLMVCSVLRKFHPVHGLWQESMPYTAVVVLLLHMLLHHDPPAGMCHVMLRIPEAVTACIVRALWTRLQDLARSRALSLMDDLVNNLDKCCRTEEPCSCWLPSGRP